VRVPRGKGILFCRRPGRRGLALGLAERTQKQTEQNHSSLGHGARSMSATLLLATSIPLPFCAW
jgi:hypothetical protein